MGGKLDGMKTVRAAHLPFAVLLLPAVTLALALICSASAASATTTAVPRVALPAPTGSSPVGTVSLRVVDRSRRDTLARGRAKPPRELMVQLWYPAARKAARPAPYLPPRTARLLARGLRAPAGAFAQVRTHAFLGASPAIVAGRFPVVLFSPGFRVQRSFYTSLVEDLASHGYVVVGVDYPYETGIIEFPNGRLVHGTLPDTRAAVERALQVRLRDARFLVDHLGHLAKRARLHGRLDLDRTATVGHSLGGATAAAAMHADSRIDAGIDLDGSLFGPVVQTGLDRPFMTMSQPLAWELDDSLKAFMNNHRGPRLNVVLNGSEHYTFTDTAPLIRWLERLVPDIRKQVPVGSIDGSRAITIQRAYIRAFLSEHLLGRHDPLLTGPAAAYPEVDHRPTPPVPTSGGALR